MIFPVGRGKESTLSIGFGLPRWQETQATSNDLSIFPRYFELMSCIMVNILRALRFSSFWP